MSEIKFFDINCFMGKRNHYNGRFFWKKKDLIKNMEYYNIDSALVCHSYTKEYHPLVGNKEIIRETKDISNLYPCWGLLPNNSNNSYSEFLTPNEYIKQMKENEVIFVRVFPNKSIHWFSLEEWSIGNFLNELEKNDIPIIIDYSRFPYKKPGTADEVPKIEFNQIYKICKNHPDLFVILVGPGYRSLRNLTALFRNCPRLKIEISRFMTHRGLEFICKEFGAHRLLFGSNLPYQSPGAIISMVLNSKISLEEKKLIAGENVTNLLKLGGK